MATGRPSVIPAGMQVIGPRYADLDVKAACAAFGGRRPWRDSYGIPANRSLS